MYDDIVKIKVISFCFHHVIEYMGTTYATALGDDIGNLSDLLKTGGGLTILLSRRIKCSQAPGSMSLKTTALLFLFRSTCELCRSAVRVSTCS